MRTTQAARYARWSAAVALLLATAVLGVYASRAWQAHLALRAMRPSVPASVQEQTAGFALSKVTGERTQFTVRASHATEFTEGGRTELEDVWVTAYGQDGLRFDNMRSRACDYVQPTGNMTCAGEVQIDLQSAGDAQLHPSTPPSANPSAQIVHIETSGVSFNRGTGLASTEQPVTFHFPQGDGHAIGFRYDAGIGQLSLLHSVEMTLHGATTPSGPVSTEPVLNVSSSSMTYDRDARVIHFVGPVQARRGVPELTAGMVDVELDTNMRANKIVAADHPVLRDTGSGDNLSVSADQLSALLSPDSSAQEITGVGNVHALARRAIGEDRLNADRAVLELAGRTNRPRRLTATGSVTASATRPGGLHQNLTSSALQVDFAAEGKQGQARIVRATTPAGALDWEGPAQAAGREATQREHMTSQHWEAKFGRENELEELRGSGGTQVERRMGSEPPEIGTSRDLLAHFTPDGEWSNIDQTGDVTLREPDRTAHADLAHYDRVADTVALSGSVTLSDSDSVTTAQKATLHQVGNDFHAEGRVATIQLDSGAPVTDFGPGSARVTSDRLNVNTATGHAIYSGSARLWQGGSVVEGETIELDRATHVLTANGRVRAIFPQAQLEQSTGPSSGQSPRPPASHPASKTPSKNEYWHAEAQRMTYMSDEGRGRLEQSVVAHSDEGSIRSDAMDLFFSPPESGPQQPMPVAVASKSKSGVASPSSSGTAPGTGRQLVRAAGLGNVEVTQEDRRGTASRADYTAADGKFVLSGGSPIVRDASGNSVAGRQLTLFFADDTIVVDSAEGLRTLTLHRVGK